MWACRGPYVRAEDAASVTAPASCAPATRRDTSRDCAGLSVDRLAERQPAEPVANVGGRARGLALDRLPTLLEVRPPLVVDRNRRPGTQLRAERDGVARGHRVPQRPSDGE